MKPVKIKKLYRVTLSKTDTKQKIQDVDTTDVVAFDVNQAIRKVKYRLTQEGKDDIFIDGAVRIGVIGIK